jgi:hypothetical protein
MKESTTIVIATIILFFLYLVYNYNSIVNTREIYVIKNKINKCKEKINKYKTNEKIIKEYEKKQKELIEKKREMNYFDKMDLYIKDFSIFQQILYKYNKILNTKLEKRFKEKIKQKKKEKPKNPIKILSLNGDIFYENHKITDTQMTKECEIKCEIHTNNLTNPDILIHNQYQKRLEITAKYPNLNPKAYSVLILPKDLEKEMNIFKNTPFNKILDSMEDIINSDIIIGYSKYSDVIYNLIYSVYDHYNEDSPNLFENFQTVNKKLLINEIDKKKEIFSTIFYKNCEEDHQIEFINKIKEEIEISPFQHCITRSIEEINDYLLFKNIQKKSKFQFIFENYFENDYVSEKYYQILSSNTGI